MSRLDTLVIGAGGLVGSYLVRDYQAHGVPVLGTAHRRGPEAMTRLDIARLQDVMDLVECVRPRTIIVSAALTDVDRCEREPATGYVVNVAGPCHVARAALAVRARMVYLSTDYVFDGTEGPYAEDAIPRPLSAYGRQKLAAEGLVNSLPGDLGLVVRTTWVFGWEHPARNFVARLVASNRAGGSVRVPVDQVASPTYAGDLAAAIRELDAQGAAGVIHVSGRSVLGRHEFACLAAATFGLDIGLIVPATTADLVQDAPRPLRAGLRVARAEALLGRRLATAAEGLQAMRRERPSDHV